MEDDFRQGTSTDTIVHPDIFWHFKWATRKLQIGGSTLLLTVIEVYYLPRRHILSELFVHHTADWHQISLAGHLRRIIHPQIIFKVLAVNNEETKSYYPCNLPFTSWETGIIIYHFFKKKTYTILQIASNITSRAGYYTKKGAFKAVWTITANDLPTGKLLLIKEFSVYLVEGLHYPNGGH